MCANAHRAPYLGLPWLYTLSHSRLPRLCPGFVRKVLTDWLVLAVISYGCCDDAPASQVPLLAQNGVRPLPLAVKALLICFCPIRRTIWHHSCLPIDRPTQLRLTILEVMLVRSQFSITEPDRMHRACWAARHTPRVGIAWIGVVPFHSRAANGTYLAHRSLQGLSKSLFCGVHLFTIASVFGCFAHGPRLPLRFGS
jgi:hypothetical protein